MSRVIQWHWPGNPDALSRRGRLPCGYEAHVPDPLVGRLIMLDGDIAADVADAQAALTGLNAQATALADTEGLARLLLRAESVASSRIEGLEVGARKLLRTEAARQLGERTVDLTAAEVLGNINAMNAAGRCHLADRRYHGTGSQGKPDAISSSSHRTRLGSAPRPATASAPLATELQRGIRAVIEHASKVETMDTHAYPNAV